MTKIALNTVENAPHIWSFQNDYLKIQSDQLQQSDTLVSSVKIKNYLIPAIFYWGWNSTIQCNLSPAFGIANFKESFLAYAAETNLNDKLKGRKLEISIDNIPHSFVYTSKGDIIILILAYSTSSLNAMYTPKPQSLDITYRVLEGNEILKTGKLSAKSKLGTVKNETSYSAKKFTKVYIDAHWDDVKMLTESIVDELLLEL